MQSLKLICAIFFLVVAATSQNVVAPTFMGMHAHSGAFPSSIGAYRGWDAGCRWNAMNPSYGRYSFSWCFGLYDQAKGRGAKETIFTFGEVPSWASTEPWLTGCSGGNNGACAPPILSDWRAFVTALAQYSAHQKAIGHAGITIYELWNEPNAGNFWRGTNAQMVALAAAAYPLIHQYDSFARVATPAPQGTFGYSWMSGYFAAGGARYVDAVDFHGYVGTAMPESGMANVAKLRSLMSQYGITQPLNDTEHYWWGYTGSSQTAWLSRHMVLTAAQGIAIDCWYAWAFGGSISGTSNATVYSNVGRWLVGRTVFPVAVSGSVYKVGLSQGTWVGVVVWTAGSSTWIAPPSSAYHHYTDVWGTVRSINGSVPIGFLPVLISF